MTSKNALSIIVSATSDGSDLNLRQTLGPFNPTKKVLANAIKRFNELNSNSNIMNDVGVAMNIEKDDDNEGEGI